MSGRSPSTDTAPAFRVLEAFILGKRDDPALCEDAIVITDDYAAVFDGATDISGATFDGVSGGRFASQTLADATLSLPATATAREAVDFLTWTLADALTASLSAGTPAYRPNATMVMYSAHARQVWRVGDAQAIIGSVTYPGVKEIDDVTVQWRRAWNAALLLKGATPADIAKDDPGFAAMWPLVEMQDVFANRTCTPWGYGVIDGTAVPDAFIQVIDSPAGRDVILASDGYPHALPTLARSEADVAVRLATDPLGARTLSRAVKPGWVSFDDRAYVRLVAQ